VQQIWPYYKEPRAKYQILANLGKNEMKTKKLVLSVFVLAAFTGAAPQVFGALESWHPTVRTWKQPILSSAPERQRTYEEILDFTKQRLEAETARLVEIGEEEVRYVEEALLYWINAIFISGIAVGNCNSAKLRVNSIRDDLRIARESVRGYIWSTTVNETVRRAKEEVDRLESELALAEKHEADMLEQFDKSNVLVGDYLENSLRLREKASVSRAERFALFRNLNKSERLRRGENGQKNDLAKVERSRDVTELEMLRVRGAKDTLIVQEECRRYSNEKKFTESINGVILRYIHKLSNYVVGYDYGLCCRVQTLCKNRELGYDYVSVPQEHRLANDFGKSYMLEFNAERAIYLLQAESERRLGGALSPFGSARGVRYRPWYIRPVSNDQNQAFGVRMGIF
jgi:hypothetical protein